jgi:dihydroceramidase
LHAMASGEREVSVLDALVLGKEYAHASAQQGFWDAWGARGINWCEPDYVVPYVAELWNTLSNAAFVAAGVAGLRICARQRLPARFYALAWSLVGLGITSGAFHATLLWVNQKLDESFENVALIVLFHSDKPSQAATLLHSAAASVGIFTITAFLFCELHLIGIVLLTLIKVRNRVQMADLATKGAAGLHGAVRLAACSALAGFACWLVDRLFCAHLLSLAFNPQLHAIWHLACGVALYEAFGKSF